jgi:hypothetical protein
MLIGASSVSQRSKLTGSAEGSGPHLGELENNLLEVFKRDSLLVALVEQLEALGQLFVFRAVHKHVQVAQVVAKSDVALALLVHNLEHSVSHEGQTLHAYQAERVSELLVTHLLVH